MKEITLACEAFQKLLEEQLERIRNMNGEKTDFSTKKQVTIGVIDGDGIGPVITAQATRVLEKLLAEEIAAGSIVIKQIEGRRAGERIGAHAYQIAFLEVFAHRCIFAGVGNAIRSGAQGHAHAALT